MREILVPIDFTGASQRAGDLAVSLATALEAGVVLLRVVEPLPALVVDAAASSTLVAAEAKALADRAELLRPHAPSLQTELVSGTAWEEIVRVADERAVDLVVMGTHGRRGVSRALLGSVAERVVRMCRRPVATVPGWWFASREEAGARLAAELGPMGLSTPMVIALRRGAIPIARTMARALGGSSDVWLVAPVAVDGKIVGAVTEEGQSVFDTEPSDPATEDARRVATLAARRVLEEELLAVRKGRSIGDVWHRDVVLVDDGLVSPSTLVAAAKSLRGFTPHRIVAAVPLAERDALPVVERSVDRLFYLQPVVGCDDRSSWYRDPSTNEVRARIDEAEPATIGSRAAR